jgi:hypothetical protein
MNQITPTYLITKVVMAAVGWYIVDYNHTMCETIILSGPIGSMAGGHTLLHMPLPYTTTLEHGCGSRRIQSQLS